MLSKAELPSYFIIYMINYLMNSILSKLTIFNVLLISLFINTIETVSADELQTQTWSAIIQETSSGSISDDVQRLQTWSTSPQETIVEKTPLSEEDNLDNVTVDTKKETFFVVTAYYSPLPDQKYYLRGNYEDEVILNGRWVRWASGKAVFPWMLAAPKTYNFGTKIYLEWIWVWEVADRWGAIVKAGERGYEYDRIDIWMGSGDEGLKRALAFWKKVVPWYVIEDSSRGVEINLSKFPSPESAVKWLEKRDKVNVSVPKEVDVFDLRLSPESTDTQNIKKLQKLMYEIWATKSLQTSGKYADLKNDLINYQLDREIIARREDEQAGYFGPKTSKKMKEDYLADIDQKKIEEKIKKIKIRAEANAKSIIARIGNPKFGQKWNNVKLLQQALKSLWATNNPASGVFGDKTEFALKKYQLSKGIITSKESEWAWVFGPKTKIQMEKDLVIFIEKSLFQQENLMAYYKK